MKLSGKVAIVTGAGRGIGRATALALADEGAAVVLAARSTDEIESAAADVRQRLVDGEPARALAIPCDITSEAEVAALVERTLAEFGRIDVLVNNAGYSKKCLIADLTVAELNTALEVNIVGTFLCCQAVLPAMKRQGGGRIVNVVSGSGKRGSAQRAAYTAAKFGVIGFSQCLQIETVADGIGVCCVCPGPVDTRMRAFNNPGEDRTKILPPEEIAEAIVFAATRGSQTIISEFEVRPRDFISF
jgi:NAD(P)-dependent dehydrogenase (short-subunit alcohol dehydrogenase family)